MSEINPEYLDETLAKLFAWWDDGGPTANYDSPGTGTALFSMCPRLFAAPQPAPRSEAEQALRCRHIEQAVRFSDCPSVSLLPFGDDAAKVIETCDACAVDLRTLLPGDPAEQAVLDAVQAWAAFVHRTGYAVHRGPSELERLTRAAFALYPEQPPTCAMPRCGKAFIPPEPWYFERGDGVLLPLCHDCHYVVQQPR